MNPVRGSAARVVLGDVRRAGPAAIAARLGYDLVRGTLSPCPSCRALFRSSRGIDKRGPVGLTLDGFGWRCHRCGAAGDAVAFAAFAACNTATPTEWRPVLELLERRGLGGATTLSTPMLEVA